MSLILIRLKITDAVIKASGLTCGVARNRVTAVYFFVAGEYSYQFTSALRLLP
jgi:hypothetical protein